MREASSNTTQSPGTGEVEAEVQGLPHLHLALEVGMGLHETLSEKQQKSVDSQ